MTLDKLFHLKLKRSYIILWHIFLLDTLTVCLESSQKLTRHLSYLQEQATNLLSESDELGSCRLFICVKYFVQLQQIPVIVANFCRINGSYNPG
jgi:hypothetical protein